MALGNTKSGLDLAPGARLHRYELLCLVAAGGMANVWAARPCDGHGADRLVALKTILPKFAADPRFQEMFLREGGIAARITHRNVARIFDLGEVQGVLYIAMEYVDGEALSKLDRGCQRKGARIPPGIVLRVLADVSAGLHHAHELRDGTGRLLNVVHRDVSPPNILLSTKGIAKLIDFGIAKTHLASAEDTEPGVLKGKARYMAPEQALGLAIDRRVDIWAAGAILYDLLTGRPPYEAENPMATLRLIASGRPPAPLPPDVHPRVAAIVTRALAYEADDRFATAAQLHEALEDAMVAARLESATEDVSTFAAQYLSERTEKRRRGIEAALAQTRTLAPTPNRAHPIRFNRKWLAIGLLLAGLLAAAAGIWLASHRAGHARGPSRSPASLGENGGSE